MRIEIKGRGEWLFGEVVDVMRNRGEDKLGGQNDHRRLIREPGI